MIKVFGDPITSPFNEWLKANGLCLAIAVAAVILTIVVTIFLLSSHKKG